MDPQLQSTSGPHSSPQIFKKRAGTTDIGKEYENFLIANIILKLVEDDNVEDFWLSSNDEAFGSFDDVVVEIKYRDSENTVTYAIQLKHKDNNKISVRHLARERGDFSIIKYFKDYLRTNNLKTESVILILFTNCEYYEEANFVLGLDYKLYDVEVLRHQSDELISTTKKGCCFIFKWDYENSDFFKRFFLYTSQLRAGALKKSCLNNFRTLFSCDDKIYNEYLNFITDWSMTKGKKKRLNKDWMRRSILVRVLSPFVQTLSFKTEPLNPKLKILHKVVSTFQVTLLYERNSYDYLKKNWEDAIINVHMKQFNDTNNMYQVTTDYFQQIDESIQENVEVNIILWLMKKCPLVIEADKPGVKQTLNLLLRDEKLIILSPNFDVKLLKSLQNNQHACFECLSDLKNAPEVYDEVLDSFVISIEGQKESTLREIIAAVQDVESDFKTDTLVKLVNDPLVGHRNEDFGLPMHYVSRRLSRIIIDSKYLEKFDKNTLIIVTHVTETFTQWCHLKNFFFVGFSPKCNQPMETQSTKRTIYVTGENCSQQQFNEFCEKYKQSNCHQFRYVSCDQLEWKRSKNDVCELKDYRLEDIHYIEESELFNCSDNNSINIICENPGMGKTTLMKSLKSGTPSTCWTIFMFAKNCAQHFKENQVNVGTFLEYILMDSCKNCMDLDKTILDKFLKNGKIQVVWDGINSSETLKIIKKLIDKTNKRGIRQWLTSRVNLKDELMQQFDVLSRSFQKFSEIEQINYIQNRLSCTDKESSRILSKIKSYNKDLQPDNSIFMLTELFFIDKNKYLYLLDNNSSTIVDLYKYFIKKIICDYYKENNDLKNAIRNEINKYKMIAIRHYLRLDLYVNMGNECEILLKHIKKDDDPIGIIIKVTEDLNPQFSHNFYGEYFAALYLSENYYVLEEIRDFYLNDKYVNIRFFLDLILAKGLKAHIAVLRLNSQLLDDCTENDINCKDKEGRTCFQLSCKWFKRYPFLETFKSPYCYNIITSKVDDTSLERFSKTVEIYFSELLDIFKRAILPFKKVILLFPFILLFLKENEQLERLAIPSILYYAIKFDHKIVLKRIRDFPYTLICDDENDKTLLHLAITLKRIHFIKSFLLNPMYKELIQNDLSLWYEICALKSTDLLQVCKSFGCDLNKKYTYSSQFATVHLLYNDWTVMHYVCSETNDISTLKFLIENCVDINFSDSEWYELVHMAYQNASVNNDMVKLIVTNVDLTVSDRDGNLPLHLACYYGDFNHDIIKHLLNKFGEQVDVCNREWQLPIHLACMNHSCSIDIVKYLVKSGSSVNISDKNGNLPIHIACENKVFGNDIVKYLVECGSSVNGSNKNGNIPIHIACKNKWCGEDIVKYLVECGSSVNKCDKNGNLPIHIACQNEWCVTDVVKYLVECGSSVNECDKNGNLPIHIACENKWFGKSIVKYLVECGSGVNDCDENGSMPIHIASKNEGCGADIVKHLIERGSSVNKCDKNKIMPIHNACMNEECAKDIVKLLIESGSSVNDCDENGNMPIHIACSNQKCGKDLVRYLIECGSSINVCDKNGDMPIHIACSNKKCGEDIVKYLVESGSSVNDCNKDETMPIHIACINEECGECIVKHLVDCGSCVNVCDKNKNMPIHTACYNKECGKDIVQYLIECGSSVNDCDANGNLPIHIACRNKRCGKDIVQYLIKCGSNTQVCNKSGIFPIHLACKNKGCGEDIVKYLVDAGCSVNIICDIDETFPIHLACLNKECATEIVKYLVECGSSVNECDKYGSLPIHTACLNEKCGKDVVEYLIKCGSNTKISDTYGNLPIHIACTNKTLGLDIVNCLLAYGSNIEVYNKNKTFPIHIACMNETLGIDIVKYLIQCGASVNECDIEGNLPIHNACENKRLGKGIVKCLVEVGSNIEIYNEIEELPIHIACRNEGCGSDIVKYFVECGFSVEVCDKNEDLPIHIACRNESCGKDIVQYLIQCGSTVNNYDKNGNLPIHIACRSEGCGKNIVRCLVECGLGINDWDRNGNLPIHIACWNESCGKHIVRYLVEGGSSVNDCDRNGSFPIHIACRNEGCGKDMVKYLIECGLSVNDCDGDRNLPIHLACWNKNCGKDIVKYLVESGSSVNDCDRNGNLPIHIACRNEECGEDIIKYLVECGVSINVCDKNGKLPLHIACANERCGQDIVKYFVERGSSVNVCDKNGNMPIHIACKNGGCGDDIVKYLLKYNSSVDVCDGDGNYPIHLACSNERCGIAIVETLLKHGSSVSDCDRDGNFAIHVACKNEECGKSIVKYLVECGSSVNVCNKSESLPIHLACMNEGSGRDIVKYLVERGCSVNDCDENKSLPIHIACRNESCDIDVVKYLLECGSSVNVCDSDGNFPIHSACKDNENGYDIVKLLIEKGASVNVTNRMGLKPVDYVSDDNKKLIKLLRSRLKVDNRLRTKTNKTWKF